MHRCLQRFADPRLQNELYRKQAKISQISEKLLEYRKTVRHFGMAISVETGSIAVALSSGDQDGALARLLALRDRVNTDTRNLSQLEE